MRRVKFGDIQTEIPALKHCGDVKFLSNHDGADLIISNEVIGVYVEQANALFVSTGIKAPNAVIIQRAGSCAFRYSLSF